MTPRQEYLALVRQGYTPERAAQRSGWSPKAHVPAVAAPPAPERPAQASMEPPAPPTRPEPTDAQRAWKRGGMVDRAPTAAQRAWNGQRPLTRPARTGVTVPFTRTVLPDARPPAEPAPRPESARRERPRLALVPQADLGWQDEALCAQVDTEMFFPEKGGSTREAKRICGACPVREACLAYALDHDERFGIYGGLSERERRKIKRGDTPVRRRKAACVHGHAYTDENTGVRASGAIWCKTCERLAKGTGGAA